jgi:glycosyltransferase involved in cell wall biosynthesis
MRLLLEAPILTRSGYGEHARLVYRSLKNVPNLEIFIKAVDWGNTSWEAEYPEDIHDCIIAYSQHAAECESKKVQESYDVQVHVGILNEFQKKAPYSVVVTAGIETDKVSSNWLIKTNQGVNKLIVPSNHAKEGFLTTSYEVTNTVKNITTTLECGSPVEVVPYPVKSHNEVDLNLNLETDFNFLNVGLLGSRKNIENSIDWFLEEFRDDPNVGYIIKTARARGSLTDRRYVEDVFTSLKARHPNSKCKVYLIHGNMTEQEVHSLYKHPKIKAYLTSTLGEGFGLPIFEAAYSGLPVVATDWSGHLDFLSAPYKEGGKVKNKKLFAKIDYAIAKVPDHVVWKDVIIEESCWAYPNPVSFKNQIRKVYKNYGMYRKWAKALQSHVAEEFSDKNVKMSMFNAIMKDYIKPTEQLD